LDAEKNARALQLSAQEKFDRAAQNSFAATGKMSDGIFFDFIFRLSLHFLLDKIIDCHYTLTEHALRQLLAGANSRRLRGE